MIGELALGAFIKTLVDTLAKAARADEVLRKFVLGDPGKNALALRLTTAFRAFEDEDLGNLFDEEFLKETAAPLIAEHLLRLDDMTDRLAQAWASCLPGSEESRKDLARAYRSRIARFLALLDGELRKEPLFQSAFDRGAWDQTAGATKETALASRRTADAIECMNRRDEERLAASSRPSPVLPTRERPKLFVPRPETTAPLLDRLCRETDDDTHGVVAITAVHGLGGMGKTTVAADLIWRPEIETRFPDGRIWVTLGRENADVPSILINQVLRPLDPKLVKPDSLEGAKAVLGDLLAQRQVLIVIDDAWNEKDVKPFLVPAARDCRWLVTTRQTGLARELDLHAVPLDQMSPDQALELVTRLLDRPLHESERPTVKELAKTVCFHPLALELATRAVRENGEQWNALLKDMREDVARWDTLDDSYFDEKDTDEMRQRQQSLRACLLTSVRALTHGDTPRFARLGTLVEDASFGATTAAVLWNEPERIARSALTRMERRGLILGGHDTGFHLHDLMVDTARSLLTGPTSGERTLGIPGLSRSLEEASGDLIDRYRPANGLWHTLADDGYILDHLAGHLVQAGRMDELFALLSETDAKQRNGWFEISENRGRRAEFTAILEEAWKFADAEWINSFNKAVTKRGLAHALYCALVQVSVAGLFENIPPKILFAAVKEKVLPIGQAFAIARSYRAPEWRVEATSLLIPSLSPVDRSSALHDVLSDVQLIESEWLQAEALASLSPCLPNPLLTEAIAIAFTIERDQERWKAVGSLVSQLSEEDHAEEMSRILEKVRGKNNNKGALGQALVSLTPYLPTKMHSEALIDARSLGDDRKHADILMLLANKLSPARLDEALADARGLRNDEARKIALKAIIVNLPDTQMDKAILAIRAISDGRERVATLTSLLPRLSNSRLILMARQLARKIGGLMDISLALSSVSQYMPDRKRCAMLADAIKAAEKIEVDKDRAQALAAAYCLLPYNKRKSVFSKVLEAAYAIADCGAQVEVLSLLIPRLPVVEQSVVRKKALASLHQVKDNGKRVKLLAKLATFMNIFDKQNMITEILRNIGYVNNASDRASIIVSIMANMNSRILVEMLTSPNVIREGNERVKMLTCLAPHLPKAVLVDVMVMARRIGDEKARMKAITSLRQYNLDIKVDQIVNNENGEIAPVTQLSEARATMALSAARMIETVNDRVKTLVSLLPRLSDAERVWVLAEVQDGVPYLYDIDNRIDILISLPPNLSEVRRAKALHDIHSAALQSSNRARALTALIPHLSGEERTKVMDEAFDAIWGIIDNTARSHELLSLAPHLSKPELESLMTNKKAKAVVSKDDIVAIRQYLSEGGRIARLRSVLDSVKEIKEVGSRAVTLGNIAPCLPEVLLPEIVAAVQAIGDDWHRVPILRIVAENFAAKDDKPELRRALAAIIRHSAGRSRTSFLGDLMALIPIISRIGGDDSLGELARSIQGIGRWWP